MLLKSICTLVDKNLKKKHYNRFRGRGLGDIHGVTKNE